jgi:hypothetical protein
VVDGDRIPKEKSSGCSAMRRILGVRGVMVRTSVALPSADWGEGTAKNTLSAGKREEIVLEGIRQNPEF